MFFVCIFLQDLLGKCLLEEVSIPAPYSKLASAVWAVVCDIIFPIIIVKEC